MSEVTLIPTETILYLLDIGYEAHELALLNVHQLQELVEHEYNEMIAEFNDRDFDV